MCNRILFLLLILSLPLSGSWYLGHEACIQARAAFAQILLESAWADTHRGQKEVKPWPWADVRPVGRLTVPRLGISRIVLAGASVEALAYGPGRLFSARDSGTGTHTVIAGHRYTHFRFLRQVREGDHINLHDHEGNIHHYAVIDVRLLNEEQFLPYVARGETLSMVTCWPFDASRPCISLRLVVTASKFRTSRPV